MAILSKGTTYADGDQITSTNLNALVDSATFASGAVESGGGIQLNGSGQLKVAGNIDIGTSNLTATGTISLGTTSFNDNNITNVGSIALDTITNDGTDVTIDSSGDIVLDAGGQDITFKDDGTQFGRIAQSSSNLVVASSVSDKDILFQGSDSGSTITALTLDMSAAGAATFNDKITAVGTSVFTNLDISGDVTVDTTTLKVDSSNNRVGIGTASPAHKLDVNSGATNQVALFESTDETAYIELADSTGSAQLVTLGSGDLRISTGGSGAGNVGTSGLYITQGQDVGIGDDTPSYKLDVNGTGRFTGVLSANSNLEVSGTIKESVDNGNLVLQGGGSGGANIELYGTSHSSAPNGANYDANIHRFRPVDASANSLNIIQNGNVGINVDTPSYLLDINDDAATGVGIRVTGGGNGGPLAQFVRDVSSSGSLEINLAGGDPQLKLTSSGSDVMAIGLDGSENSFQVCSGSGVGANQVLVVGTNGKVGIGETVPSAPLTVTSTTGGVLMPRMTTTQMNAISSPANGEMIYNTTANKFYGYANGAWVALH